MRHARPILSAQERDVSKWAHEALRRHLLALESEDRDLILEVVAVKDVAGTASVFSARGTVSVDMDLPEGWRRVLWSVRWGGSERMDCDRP